MKPNVILKLLSFLVIFLPPQVLATYYYNTEEIQQQIISQAKRHDIAPSLALAIAKVESNFNPEALSHSGAKGVMQIMPRTAEQAFGVSRERLFEPEINIELGIKFIKVDLPEPLAPTTTTFSPGFIVQLMFFKMA